MAVWKTVDSVTSLGGGSYKVTGKIYIENLGDYNAYILDIKDYVQHWDGDNWVKVADGVIIGFSPGYIIPPHTTIAFDYEVIINSPTAFPLGYGNQGTVASHYLCPPEHKWKNVVKVKLFNCCDGIHVYTDTEEFHLPE